MNRIAPLAVLAIALLTAAPASAEEPRSQAETVRDATEDSLQDVRSRTQAVWARARAARDSMNTLRHDGSLATDVGKAEMAELREELSACRAAVQGLKLERRTIIAARKAARSGVALAVR